MVAGMINWWLELDGVWWVILIRLAGCINDGLRFRGFSTDCKLIKN